MSPAPDSSIVIQRRRILFLAKLFPWPLNFGARQRVFHLARGMAAAHDITVVALDDAPSAEAIDTFRHAAGCADVSVVARATSDATELASRNVLQRLVSKLASLDERLRSPLPRFVTDVWSPALLSELAALRNREQFDMVYATQSWMAEHARAAGFARITVDVDDLMSAMSSRRAAAAPWSARTPIDRFDAAKDARYERSLPRRFGHVVVAKDDDVRYFAPAERARVSVVPNGIRVPSAPLADPLGPSALLFVGTLGYGPNIDAIRWLASEIMPLVWQAHPEVRLDVAGYGSGAHLTALLGDPRCALHESPAELVSLYTAASVVVAPIRTGGGTRIKILEALALGRAMVCTEFAAEGLGLRDGVDLVFADDAPAFAAAIVRLLDDPGRARALAAEGRVRVAARFDWVTIEREIPDLLARIHAESGAARA